MVCELYLNKAVNKYIYILDLLDGGGENLL